MQGGVKFFFGRPFNRDRLSGLLKGLEAAIVTSSDLPLDLRFDAQFFQKAYIAEDQALHRHKLKLIGTGAFVTDGPHGYHAVDEQAPTAMLTAKCAASWFADRSPAETVADWVVQANKRSLLKVDDLILSTRGTVGNCAIVTQEALPAIIDQDVARISLDVGGDLLPQFVVAYLNSCFGQDHINRHSSGMVQQGMSLAKVRNIPIPLLGAAFQIRIRGTVDEALAKKRLALSRTVEAERRLLELLGLADWTPPEPLAYTATAADVFTSGRFDAQYFMPAKEQVMKSLAALPGQLLSARVDSIRDQWVPDRALPTLRVRNYDVTDALVPLLDAEKDVSFAADIGSMKKVLKDGDVAISRLRAYLKEVAVVRTGDDVPSVGSSEFIVLRPKGNVISPEALMVFLRSAPVQTILKWCQDGSQHPRFSEGDLLSIPVPDALAKASDQIAKIVQDGFTARHHARKLLEVAKCAVEIAIENGEPAAMAYLDQAAEVI